MNIKQIYKNKNIALNIRTTGLILIKEEKHHVSQQSECEYFQKVELLQLS